MVIVAQRTIFGIMKAVKQEHGLAYKPQLNTTLNEHFNILNGVDVDESFYPTTNYFSIGVGGLEVIENGGYVLSKHSPIDGNLFKMIPFVMKELTEDLNSDEREEYRFRRVETFDGIDYACYYFKKIPEIESRDYFYKISTVNGETILGVYDTNTDKILNPEPSDREINTIDITQSNYVTAISKLKFSLSIAELDMIKKVMSIRKITGSKITEIGLVMGIEYSQEDKTHELARAQISHHVTVSLNTSIYLDTNKPVLRSIELGGTEPILT